jgi:peptide/nickel transport system ATP-binding protein
MAILEIEGLKIAARSSNLNIVKSCSLSIERAKVVGIVGESGSGKTMIAKSILDLLPPGVERTAGTIIIDGVDVTRLSPSQLRSIRGNAVGMIFQEPMTSLNPSMTIGRQLEEGLRLHRRFSREERHARIVAMLTRIGIREPEAALLSYPHQFSGGMRQRIVIAAVMLLEPALLIADEPTTALDAIIQQEVLELMIELTREKGTAILLISHDLAMISRHTDRTVVMAHGEIVEAGFTADVMARPTHPYTRKLLSSVPRREAARTVGNVPVIEIEGLAVDYRVVRRFSWKGGLKRVVENFDLKIYSGEVVAVVGESGSGKTTVGKAVAGLLEPSSGKILFDGKPIERGGPNYRQYRHNCQMIFQDPFSSLDPRMTIGEIVEEPLRISGTESNAQKRNRALAILKEVGLAFEFGDRYPHQLSGGQRQRVAIARALVTSPKFIVADEPVSALDVTVRKQVLELFNQLQRRYGFSCLFITHDLDVVDAVADRVVVMRAGKVVESTLTETFFKNPEHEYTKRLLLARRPKIEVQKGVNDRKPPEAEC